jgi:hypothetical protein
MGAQVILLKGYGHPGMAERCSKVYVSTAAGLEETGHSLILHKLGTQESPEICLQETQKPWSHRKHKHLAAFQKYNSRA